MSIEESRSQGHWQIKDAARVPEALSTEFGGIERGQVSSMQGSESHMTYHIAQLANLGDFEAPLLSPESKATSLLV